ncbi:ABC transporter ATP-binding protein [Bosea sp. (in: a-proteobacteria)]|jgi:iron(III) transport system ATP-binding protein|uniref:ABC transporter ATP-binding protein n=1 Tax=Bosea sp. (in: a-proteobacteria) TaxID=1871050 RepID=UPI002DDCFA24|nr:ABC transporter ATP-binding protein [Bosea sp. (in: a-proteobacteria)]HEV2512268.1 ABC transporter ATP-binding protein [Bosea sp. (in: a-proteobacteria)]
MTDLVVNNVQKWLGGVQILSGASFVAEKGRIVALLGASGSGKTTLLRCIAGLEQPELGIIRIGGTTVLDDKAGVALPPEQRQIGLVFQSYALWPHRTVFDNVAYGLKLRNVPAGEIKAKVEAILEKLGLAHLAARYPDQLSGGQQQRVAICRALVYEPKVLLLDEPLSNLDAKLREEARFWIRKLILDLKICAIMVTHDQAEALAIADQVLLLKGGSIVQSGTPLEIYSKPETFYAADFMGTNNVLSGRLVRTSGHSDMIDCAGLSLAGIWRDREPPADANSVRAVIRMEAISVSPEPSPESAPFDVEGCIYLGEKWEYRLKRGDLRLRAQGHEPLGAAIAHCRIPASATWLYNP